MMKDYSDSKLQSSLFIKKYRIKKKIIIVYLGSGERYEVPCTKENEEKIQGMMIGQVKAASMKKNKNKKIFANLLLSIFILFFIILFLPATIVTGSVLQFFFALAALVNVCAEVHFVKKAISQHIIETDLKKQIFFLENQKSLNEHVKDNDNMLIGVKNRAISKISKTKNNKPVFDINSIDGYSLKDLRKIKENIERYKLFCFNEEIVENENGFSKRISHNIRV